MLSSDSELLKTLEENGMVNSTKNYLKNQLIETLKKQKLKNDTLNSKLLQYKNSQISSLIRLSYSIIMDFFSKMNLPYSQSTFNYEAKNLLFNTSIPYTESEIINLLNINMYEFENAKNNILLGINEPNILNNGNKIGSTFLFYLMKHSPFLKKESESQTDLNLIALPIKNEKKPNYNISDFFTIDEKLKYIEDKNNQQMNLNKLLSSQISQNRYNKYKDECDKKYQEQFKNEINRFQNIELSKMKVEENRKYSEKLEKLREEYEKEFKEKEDKLNQRINELNEKEIKLEKEYDNKQKEENKKIEEKIKLLEEKEKIIDLKYKNELEDIKTQKENLKIKEEEVDYLKENQNSIIQNEIEKAKNIYQFKLNEEKQKWNEEKEKLEEEKEKINKERNKLLKSIKDDLSLNNENEHYNEFRNEIDFLKRDLDDMRNKYTSTITENTKLKEKIDILSKNNNNKNNTNSIPLRTKNLNNQYQQMIEKNQNEIKTLKNSMKELKKDIKKDKKNISYDNKQKEENNKIGNINVNNSINMSNILKNLNQTMPAQNSQIVNENISQKTIQKPIKKTGNNNQNNIKGKRFYGTDRRKILEELEKEHDLLNIELRNQFKNLLNNDIPIFEYNKEAIEKLKDEANLNNKKYTNIKNERINYSNSLKVMDNNNNNDKNIITQEKQLNIIPQNKNENESQLSSLNDIKKASSENNNVDSSKVESKKTPKYEENNISNEENNSLKISNNEINKNENKNTLVGSIVNLPSNKNDNIKIEKSIDNIPEIPSNKEIEEISNKYNNININNNSIKQLNNSIKEEKEENQNKGIINKFQNIDIDFDSKFNNYNFNNNPNKNNSEIKNENNEDVIEEYDDYYDSVHLDKKRSTDNIDKGIIGISNISGIMKNSIKDSITGTNFDNLFQYKNVEKESLSNENDGSNLKKKAQSGNFSSSNKDQRMYNKEIKEELVNNEDSV